MSAADIAKGFLGIPSSTADGIEAVKNIAQDPALPEVMKLVNELHDANEEKNGIGLDKAVPILKVAVFARRNQWVVPLGIFTVLAVPFALGYAARGYTDKRNRKKGR